MDKDETPASLPKTLDQNRLTTIRIKHTIIVACNF